MDLSKFTTDDLKALQSGDLSKVSTSGLQALHAQAISSKAQADTAAWQATINPTNDMGTGERTLAGVGQGMNNIGNGVGQVIGKVLPEKGSFLGNAVRNGISYIPGGDAILGLERSQGDIDQAKKTDAPLLNTTAGKVGSVAGNVAAALPAVLVPGVNGYAGAAALGGVTGALQPVASDEGDLARLKNTAVGAAAGPVGVGAARVIGGVLNAGKALVQPLYQAGRDQIAGKVLARFADNPNAISGATSQPTITGALPTLAEQTGDVGIARLQDSLRSLDPQINNAITGRLAQNNAARVVKLNELAGVDGGRDFAVASRQAAAKELYGKAFSDSAGSAEGISNVDDLIHAKYAFDGQTIPYGNSNVDLGKLAAFAAENQGLKTPEIATLPREFQRWFNLDGGPMATLSPAEQGEMTKLLQMPAVVQAMKQAQVIAKNAGTNLANQPSGSIEGLHLTKLAMDDAIDSAGANGIGANQANAIKAARDRLTTFIQRMSPEYGEARATYAAMSKPVNSMEVAAQVAKKGLSNIDDLSTGVPNIRANAFVGALKNEPQLIQQATGRSGLGSKLGDVMEPQDETMLRTIGDEANRAAAVQAAGAGTGSATAQRMASQNIVNSLIGPLGTPGGVSEGWMKSLAESVLARNALARPLNFIYSGAEPDIQKTLAKAVLDPDTAKSVLLAAQKASVRLPPNLASRLTQVASGQLANQESRNALTAP